MVTTCKKGVIEDKQVKQLETHLISERKSSEVIGVNHLLNLHTTLIHVVCFSHTGPLPGQANLYPGCHACTVPEHNIPSIQMPQ